MHQSSQGEVTYVILAKGMQLATPSAWRYQPWGLLASSARYRRSPHLFASSVTARKVVLNIENFVCCKVMGHFGKFVSSQNSYEALSYQRDSTV